MLQAKVSAVPLDRFETLLKRYFESDLIGYWPLDERSGNIAYDHSGNGYNGLYTNVTPMGIHNPFTHHPGIFLDGGTGKYIYLNDSGCPLSMNEGTFISFFCPAGDSIPGTTSGAVWYFQAGASTIWHGKNSLKGEFFVGRSVGGYKPYQNYAFPYYRDQWYMSITTWSLSQGLCRSYVNGNLLYSQALTGDEPGSMAQFLIGATGLAAGPFQGGISDIAHINRWITTEEALYAYNIGMGGHSKRILVLGDSIPTATGNYCNLLASSYVSNGAGYLINRAVGGTNIGTHLSVQVNLSINDSPDYIFIMMGTNDNDGGNMGVLQAAVESNLSSLKSLHPGAEIYWVNVLPRWTDNTGAVEVPKNNIRGAIAAGCLAQDVSCWDTYTDPWISADQTSDGLHPLAIGHRSIATRALELLP